MGEGDWSQVSVVENGGTKYEVWRDERTKLLWSDRSANEYNWYKAAGYSKDSTSSLAETTLDASPGGAYQPSQPISVCADVVDGKIAAGGGVYGNYAANPETAFKGNLSFANNVIWKLPSLSDWQLANVNGIRKVLPNTDNIFWSSSSSSYYRGYAWVIEAPEGFLYYWARENSFPVRCVGFVRD